MGGGLTAVAPDFNRAGLGVPGMNYSTLLQRSVDFDTYALVIYPNYTRELDRQLWLSQIQLLWDRGEANGYAHHMTTDPLPNTPSHNVLMHVALGTTRSRTPRPRSRRARSACAAIGRRSWPGARHGSASS